MKPRCRCAAILIVSVIAGAAWPTPASAQPARSIVTVSPSTAKLIPTTDSSRPFGAARSMQRPISLEMYGYVEEEFLVSGTGSVYDWNPDGSIAVRRGGLPYTTRILVRRPAAADRFSGTVLVDFGNRGAGFDTFGVWGQLNQHLLANGHAYVAATVFGNNLGALRMFNGTRYAALAYPRPAEACGPNRADTWKRPAEFFPPAEDGIRWDVMSQLGALLKSDSTARPLAGLRVERVYASMQSGGDLPTYINAVARNSRLADGKPVYDAFLIKDSGGPRIALHDCARPLPEGDARRTIRDVGVPVIHIVSQNAVAADTRRPDSDVKGDQFRRYELPGASHFDWWQYNYPAIADLAAAGVPPLSDHWLFPNECQPYHVAMNDFPQPYLFAGAFANLEAWVRHGTAPPRAPVIELRGEDAVVDEFGNARGGVRTPWVDVPVATFHPVMEGGGSTPFRCDDNGYWTPLPWQRLDQVYGGYQGYATRFLAAVDRMAAERWVTAADAQKIKEAFRAR
jgi:hypothetical protein